MTNTFARMFLTITFASILDLLIRPSSVNSIH